MFSSEARKLAELSPLGLSGAGSYQPPCPCFFEEKTPHPHEGAGERLVLASFPYLKGTEGSLVRSTRFQVFTSLPPVPERHGREAGEDLMRHQSHPSLKGEGDSGVRRTPVQVEPGYLPCLKGTGGKGVEDPLACLP